MYVDGDRVERESIGELFSRASAQGKEFVGAQVEVVKQTALTGVDKAKVGVALIVVGGLLAYAALIILLVALFSWLEGEIGPVGAGLVVAGVTLVLAFLMIKSGTAKVTGAVAAMSGKSN